MSFFVVAAACLLSLLALFTFGGAVIFGINTTTCGTRCYDTYHGQLYQYNAFGFFCIAVLLCGICVLVLRKIFKVYKKL